MRSYLGVVLGLAAAAATDSGVGLEFHNVTFTVKGRHILSGVSGRARAGRMLAIMGPSGSGKTSLLNALAGQVKSSGAGSSLTGTLLVDGRPVGGAAAADGVRQAYVRQEDVFYTQMTVRETLLFAARLRLPSNMSAEAKEAEVDGLIRRLGLVNVADTIVGDIKRRGISGGERKRLSIGCELLGSPNLLFLDEPTSGLDSFQALRVVDALKELAADGTTVVMSIHQPRGAIFEQFDDLLLLSGGELLYSGEASSAASHFARLGHACPSRISPAEFAVDLISIDEESSATRDATVQRIGKLAAAQRRLSSYARPPAPAAASPPRAAARGAAAARRGAGPLTQFGLLFRRAWREVARSKAVLAIKSVQQVMIALIYGGIYSLGDGQSSIQDRFGLLSLIAIGAGNLAIASTIRSFPKEKTIVMSERAKGIYGVTPYFVAKVMAEAPITAAVAALGGAAMYPLVGLQRSADKFAKFLGTLCLEGFASGALGLLLGAAAPSTDAALALFPPIIVLMIIFNGLNIAEENAPKALRWIPKVSFIRWASEGLSVNEMSGLRFECDGARGAPCCATGEQALERVSFGGSTVRRAALAQSSIIAGCYAGTLAVLRRDRPRFMTITPPHKA